MNVVKLNGVAERLTQAAVDSDRASTRSEEVKEMGSTETTKEAILLLELAIARSRASGMADEGIRACILGALEEAKRKIICLQERGDDRAGFGLILGGRGTTDTEQAKRSRAAGRTNGLLEGDLSREAQRRVEIGQRG